MLASFIGMFTSAFQQAWGPFAFSLINSPDAKKIYANIFLLFGYGMSVLASLLMLFAPGAPREAYFEGLAQLAELSDEERREWLIKNDNFFLE